MDTLELTLTKVEKYTLKPFGRFLIKWNPSKRVAEQPKILPFSEVRFDSRAGMPYTKEEEDKFCKFMKKHKTDVLMDSRGNYYTRMGDNWVEIHHKKLSQYALFLQQRGLEDKDEAWKIYENK